MLKVLELDVPGGREVAARVAAVGAGAAPGCPGTGLVTALTPSGAAGEPTELMGGAGPCRAVAAWRFNNDAVPSCEAGASRGPVRTAGWAARACPASSVGRMGKARTSTTVGRPVCSEAGGSVADGAALADADKEGSTGVMSVLSTHPCPSTEAATAHAPVHKAGLRGPARTSGFVGPVASTRPAEPVWLSRSPPPLEPARPPPPWGLRGPVGSWGPGGGAASRSVAGLGRADMGRWCHRPKARCGLNCAISALACV